MTFRFSHRATVELSQGDTRAIGAAVTVALCGHWEHTGPCRWPHLTTVESSGSVFDIRVDYTCSDDERAAVDALIDEAIRSGTLTGPEGTVTTWKTRTSGENAVS